MSEYITRSEHDAKLNATEERINAKFSEIIAEIKSIHTRIDCIDGRLTDYREDSRSAKWALWGIFAATLLGFAGVVLSITLKV